VFGSKVRHGCCCWYGPEDLAAGSSSSFGGKFPTPPSFPPSLLPSLFCCCVCFFGWGGKFRPFLVMPCSFYPFSFPPSLPPFLQELAPEDPSCSITRPFMLVINQTLGLEALGGLISQPLLDHNITNFRAMGAGTTGCFVVPLDR